MFFHVFSFLNSAGAANRQSLFFAFPAEFFFPAGDNRGIHAVMVDQLMVSKKLLLLWEVLRHGDAGTTYLFPWLTRTTPAAIWIGTVQALLDFLRGIPSRVDSIAFSALAGNGFRGRVGPRLPPFGLHLDPVDLHHIPTPFRTWGRDIPSLQVPGRTRSTAACTGGRDYTPRPQVSQDALSVSSIFSTPPSVARWNRFACFINALDSKASFNSWLSEET